MKLKQTVAAYLAVFFSLCSLQAIASTDEPQPAKKRLISYTPPMRGAPASRVGGGSRGVGDNLPKLLVLAPDHTGITVSEQPVLYWYVSKPSVAHFEVTVINDQMVEPIVSKDFELPASSGIQSLRLADFGVKLKKGIEYRWYVSLITDPDQRSNDIIASGTIQRIDPSPELRAKLSGADKASIPKIYAESGIWYNALASVSDLIDEKPGDPILREERADLLEAVGLGEAASADRTPGK